LVSTHPIASLFPYTTLFRSGWDDGGADYRARQDQHPANALVPVSDRLPTNGETVVGDCAGAQGGCAARRRRGPLGRSSPHYCQPDRKSTRLNSSHQIISYAV